MGAGASRQEVAAFVRKPNVFFLDVRSAGEFAGGHVKGSSNIPHTALAARAAELPQDKATPILVFCASGMRSSSGKTTLEGMGYNDVLNGGKWGTVDSVLRESAN